MNSISYIIVTYNSQAHFPNVIENLKRYTDVSYEIIVVDNASKDPSYIKNVDNIIHNTENKMFTPATNQGLQAANPDSEYYILINPDVRLSPNSIKNLINETKAMNAGISGAILCYPNLTVQHGGGESYGDQNISQILQMKSNSHLKYGESLNNVINQYPMDCQWVTGAVFLITNKTLKTIGLLNETYTHYKSDLEYCLRARENKIKVICSSAVCLHFHKKSTTKKQLIQRIIAKLRFKINEIQFFNALNRLNKKQK